MVAVGLAPIVRSLYAAAASSSFYGIEAVGCDLSKYVPVLPGNQSQLVIPHGQVPTHLGLAFGVQNYTCTSSNNYTNVGAFAELIDVSCYAFESWFYDLPQYTFNAWSTFDDAYTIAEVVDILHDLNPPQILAQHYFVPNPVTGSGLSPKWDFTSSGLYEGQSEAFVIAKSNGTLPSPNNATVDIAWLEVTNVEGQAAQTVFRTDTIGGQPPAKCSFGQSPNISVKYASNYVFYAGNLTANH